MATKAEIRNKVLRKLKVLPAGQSASAEDATLVEEAYDSLYLHLLQKNAVTWGSTDDIPVEAENAVVKMVAYEAADPFLSVSDEPRYARLRIEAWGQDGMSGAFGQLIEIASIDYVPLETEADYF